MKPTHADIARQARILIAALQNEAGLLRRMLSLSGLLEDALQRNDIQNILALEEAMRRTSAAAASFEKARTAAVELLSRLTGSNGPKLGDLLPSIPEPEAGTLKRLQREILTLHQRLAAMQEVNRALSASGLSTMRMLLRLLTHTAMQPATYGHAAAPAAGALFLDQKA
ncbi:MAG: flagellar export chaperone FlgN [Chthonomonadales bacterium]